MASGTYRYRVAHPPRGHYSSRAAYLRAKTGTDHQRFCEAVEAVINGQDFEPETTGADPWKGFPWLTLVLGSGCLDLPTEPPVTAEALANAVEAALSGLGSRYDREPTEGEESLIALAKSFTHSLAKDRIGQTTEQTPAATGDSAATGDAVEVGAIAARITVSAALLTRFYHEVLAAGPSAITRWDDDEAVFNRSMQGLRDLEADVVEPLVDEMNIAIEELHGAPADDEVAVAVRSVLERILSGINPPVRMQGRRLRLDHLRLITEVAWHLLVRNTPVYPGWTDLLLSLMLREGSDAESASGRPRPRHLTLTKLPEVVEALLRPATEASWRLLAQSDDESTRSRLYEAAASALWAQADAVAGRADRTDLPPAVAFVTSFDIELDMALAVQASGRSFWVAIPVHVLEGEAATEAEFCWLLGEVRGAIDGDRDFNLAAIRTPVDWRLMTPEIDEREDLRSRPVVVHLGGCPLFELPSLRGDQASAELLADFRTLNIRVDTEGSIITHAITVDEYLALRQSEAELFWISHHESDSKARRGRALAPSLTLDGDNNRRFWLAMGVPVADTAVRHRVASQMTVRWLHGGSPDEQAARSSSADNEGDTFLGNDPQAILALESRPDAVDHDTTLPRVDGAAVNLRIDDDEANLLYWLGLDVVEENTQAFTQDLLHYADHVKREGVKKRASPQTGCGL